jgi:methylmalonyl-CoA/ethylmalonyl-CoA epimerase
LSGTGGHKAWKHVRESLQTFLHDMEVETAGFGHFGIVVSSIDQSLATISESLGERPEVMRRDWVQSFNVHVARFIVENTEVEFLQPEGESFFDDFFKNRGEGLQHLAFQVDDLTRALRSLQDNGVDLIDKTPRQGSHGKIAFARPVSFAPIHLELYQVL